MAVLGEPITLWMLSSSFFFFFLTSSEIQEDNVFTKNIYQEMGNLSDSQRKSISKTPLKPLLLGKQMLYRDSCPSAILKDLFGGGNKTCQAAKKITLDLCVGIEGRQGEAYLLMVFILVLWILYYIN